MKLSLRRAAAPLRLVVWVCALFGMLSFMTGCGVLGAVANPKVAWAVNDPAPMTVVVRRVDAADATAKQVDRLMTATPASADAAWLGAVGPKKEDAAGEMKALVGEPMYAQSHARVVDAEVWGRTLPDIKSTDGSSPSLLALVSADLADKYAAITVKQSEIADVRAQIAAEKTARDAKGASDADKKKHDATIDQLEKKASKLEDEVDPLKDAFVKAAKDAAAKAPAGARDAVAPALVNLREAVEDAQIANGAAAVRYPFAVTSMPDSVKQMVPIFVADVVEEQTGHRPVLQGFHPDVSLEGTSVKLSLNGISQDDLGKINLEDLTTEIIDRTQKWVVHAVTLLGAVSSNKEALSFEQDALDALLDGFASSGWKRTEPASFPKQDAPEVAQATAKVRPHVKPGAEETGIAEHQQPAKAAKAAKADAANTDKMTAAAPAKSTTPKKTAKANRPAATPAPASPSSLPRAPMRLEDFNP